MLSLFLALSIFVYHIPQRHFYWLHVPVSAILFFMVFDSYMALVVNDKYMKNYGEWITNFYPPSVFRILKIYLVILVFLSAACLSVLVRKNRLDRWLGSRNGCRCNTGESGAADRDLFNSDDHHRRFTVGGRIRVHCNRVFA